MNIGGKTYKIKSRFRFTLFVALFLILNIMALNTILGLDNASGLTRCSYTTVQVQTGDTLWSIAETYMPDDMDVREAVYKLGQINSVSADTLQAGMELKIPQYD
ncbi:MAG: LysM peptidoglycan-binding domain-containing protein [Clostridia bacterium]|nr:LysM peptidoglycan-binding domain-containing protein [Clostridia bacterium]